MKVSKDNNGEHYNKSKIKGNNVEKTVVYIAHNAFKFKEKHS